MPYGITQCYLPPGRGDFPAFIYTHHLHWLLVHSRIQFKLSTLCFRSRTLNQPQYLSDTLHSYQPTRLLCSSTQDLLTVPRCKTVFVGRRFSVVAPRVRNSFPQELRKCEPLGTFKKHLKTHLFHKNIIHSQSLMRLRLRFYKLNSGAI